MNPFHRSHHSSCPFEYCACRQHWRDLDVNLMMAIGIAWGALHTSQVCISTVQQSFFFPRALIYRTKGPFDSLLNVLKLLHPWSKEIAPLPVFYVTCFRLFSFHFNSKWGMSTNWITFLLLVLTTLLVIENFGLMHFNICFSNPSCVSTHRLKVVIRPIIVSVDSNRSQLAQDKYHNLMNCNLKISSTNTCPNVPN